MNRTTKESSQINQFIPFEKIKQMNFEELRKEGLIRERHLFYHSIREEAFNLKKEDVLIEDIKDKLALKYSKRRSYIHGILYHNWKDGWKR